MSLMPKKQKREVYQSRLDVEAINRAKLQYKISILKQHQMMGVMDDFEKGQLAAYESSAAQGVGDED